MITELTDKQKEMTTVYRDKGIEIGFSVHDEATFDTQKIGELINKHRVMCGVPEAEVMYVADSPAQAFAKIKPLGATLDSALYGNLDISWLNYYNYYRQELGLVKETEKIVHLLELTKYVGWMWMTSDCIVITKKPVEINTYQGELTGVDIEGNPTTFPSPILHNLNGPSIKYADGFSIYHLWGYHIPEQYAWVVTQSELDIKEVMRIENADIRSLALKKIGIDKAFDVVDKKIIHEKTYSKGGAYSLFSVDFGGETPETYLRMVCPSKGSVHIEGVDPRCQTVDQALGYRTYAFGWESPEFKYLEPYAQS